MSPRAPLDPPATPKPGGLLRKLARKVRALKVKVGQAPVDFISWLPYQVKWMSHEGVIPHLLRLGNRMGKSTCGAAELIFRARGKHPFKEVRTGPVRLALVCFSLIQSVEIQRVLWELLGKENNVELVAGTEFSSKTGFKGHKPVLEWTNGSELHIYGNAQGAGALAGAEFDYILMDEPPAPEVYEECVERVKNTEGGIGITLTPINGPPLPWLRELCEQGLVADYHQPLTAESQVSPITGLVRRTKRGTPWDQDFIDKVRARTDPINAPIRLDGEWESRSEGQFFASFDPQKHVSEHLPTGTVRIALGFDFATADREKGLTATLSYIWDEKDDDEGRTFTYVHAIDEVVLPGTSTMDQLARQTRQMLRRHGVKWSELDYVYGDNPVRSRFTEASITELARCMARQLGVPQQNLKPRILNVKEGRGQSSARRRTKDIRCRWMYGELAGDRVLVHPRCKTLIQALQEWDYTDKHELKDILDAWMYSLRDIWRETVRYDELPEVVLRT